MQAIRVLSGEFTSTIGVSEEGRKIMYDEEGVNAGNGQTEYIGNGCQTRREKQRERKRDKVGCSALQ